MSKKPLSPTRIKVYDLFVSGRKTQRDIARDIGISDEAVRKQKVALIDGAFIEQIGESGYYRRGRKAHIFEQAKNQPIYLHEASNQIQPQSTLQHAGHVQEGDVNPVEFQPYCVNPEAVESLRAHMHGEMIFNVIQWGDFTNLKFIENEKEIKVPFFEEKPFLDNNNSKMHRATLSIPGKTWSVNLKFHYVQKIDGPVTTKQLTIYPPEQRLTDGDIEQDAQAQKFPQYFFEKDIWDVLNFLEKHGWKFDRDSGRLVGRMAGQVSYGYDNPLVTSHLPQNIKGFDDIPYGHFDKSPGHLEVEFSQMRNARALLTAADKFDDHDFKLASIEKQIRDLELAISEHQLETAKKLNTISELQEKIVEQDLLEMQREAISVNHRSTENHSVKTADKYGVVYL